MTKLIPFLAAAVFSCGALAQDAKTFAKDLVSISAVLPEGYDLAMSYLLDPTDSLETQAAILGGSYIIADFNEDDEDDIALLLEGRVTDPFTGDTLKPDMRAFAIYWGLGDGEFMKQIFNDSFVLGPFEGGTLGDPLRAMEYNDEANTITLNFSGGSSSSAWDYALTLSFIKGDFYVSAINYTLTDPRSGEVETKEKSFERSPTPVSELTDIWSLLE